MRNPSLAYTAPLWAYSFASYAAYKLIALRANLPVFIEYSDGHRAFVIPQFKRDKIIITVLFKPLRALMTPTRIADVDTLIDDLKTPEWRRLCRGHISFEISPQGLRFLESEASVRSKKALANPNVKRIPTFSEIKSALHQ